MSEHEPRTKIVYDNAPSTRPLRELIPHGLSVRVGDMVFGKDLTPQGHVELRRTLRKMLRAEHVTPGDDMYPAYKDAIKFIVEGQENIPKSGATLFIGNHEKSPLLAGMVHFIEAARVTNDMRTEAPDDVMRETRIIMQRGLSRPIRVFGRKVGVVTIPFSEQFYQLATDAANWITVDPPKYDKNGQIINRQGLPKGLMEEFYKGQAIFWFPQGKHDKPGNLKMPNKANDFVTKSKDHDININGLVFEQADDGFHITFTQSVHIQDFPRNEVGELDVNLFAQRFMAPCLSANRPFVISAR